MRPPDDLRAASIALVRGVPDALVRCEVTWIDREPIDVDQARRSHAEYCAALRRGGLTVVVADADEAHPDCPFVEDVVVAIGDTRVLCNPGAESRRGERAGVRAALRGPLIAMPDDLFLDGGDVLQMAGKVFVGRSTRTSSSAIAWLARVADRDVIEVPMGGPHLHLKTAATPVDDRTLLCADDGVRDRVGAILRASIPDLDVLVVPQGEAAAANVLQLPDGALLVAGGFPGTVSLLMDRGRVVRTVDIDPFARAEAGLTCLSVLLREPAQESR